MHCFFEQSGTFKNEFKKLGIEAYDYDIQNEFGETDFIIDLFAEIKAGYENKPSVFDNITSDELIFAFFPCTRFEDQILLSFRGEQHQDKCLSNTEKLERDLRLHKELHEYYELITKLSIISYKRKIPMIFENPYSVQHYLTRYWCLKPQVIDKDRTLDGDYYKKPTQYWFYNFSPKNNLVFEPIEYVEKRTWEKPISGIKKTTARSMIHPQYANRFIRKYIIEQETDFMKIWGITE